MKYLDEYRDAEVVGKLAGAIHRAVSRPWTVMEICGGQTHAIVRFGIDQMLPPQITLVHGPGCPVCVTPMAMIDRAIALANRPEVILCSYGDMLRVPGSRGDLFSAKAAGGDVRMVYSPLDCLRLAQSHPDRQVVFFAVGFETTAPVHALAVARAQQEGVTNFSLLVSQVLVPPAMTAILSSEACRVQGFLAAGHVCTVTGLSEYHPIARRFRVPVVVTGFEPVDILRGLLACVRQLESGRAEVENAYERAVHSDGNPPARAWIEKVFRVDDRDWRGIGRIPMSGYRLRDEFAAFDAERRFPFAEIEAEESTECISGQVMQGWRKPPDCPAFGTRCTPDHPLGATMVSAEGACAAYHRYRRP
ncbi:MAG: hydrogenase formation protein HypD [Verrucomicrobiales bacterium]|nr:hydrogenase formation protein HypD [Verrucomicrobiales bacterium]